MNMTNIFSVAGSALNAQSKHMDLIARNMANAQVVAGSEDTAYRALRPVFSSLLEANGLAMSGMQSALGDRHGGVRIDSFSQSIAPIEKQRLPESPLADADGYVYLSNVNLVEEMAYMMQASRAYQANIEVLNTSRQLITRTLDLGNA